MLTSDLRRTLVILADAMRDAHDPWWVISSAAVALHGAGPIEVGDVDVLLSVGDARTILDDVGVVPVDDGANALFESSVFARWTAAPMVVEFMAGFHVATAEGWIKVVPRTRVPVLVDGCVVYVPERAELARMLRLFGRRKDLERVRLLDR